MAITISGENNNDKILASDGVIDQLSGFSITGIITATTFTGNLVGNVTGNLTGNVNSTSPLLLQTDGGERFRITGNNELGIAGANYGTSGQVLTSGGSGSAVSWTTIPTQVTIANNANNRVITGGSGTNLNGEANLVFDGSSLGIGEATPSQRLQVGGNSGDACLSLMRTNAASDNNAWGHVFFENSSDATLASISARRESAADDAYLAFSTQISGGSNLEKLRITSDGKILIAQTTSNWGSTSANSVIQLKNGVVWDYAGVQLDVGHNYYYNSSGAYKYIRSGYAARQTFHNNDGSIAFWSGGTGSADGTFTWSERLRISSGGHVTINSTSYQALTITTSENGVNGPEIQLMHNTASPTAGDVVGQLRYSGKDSAGNTELYAKIETKVDDPTSGQETGHIDFSTRGLAAYNSIFRLKARGTASAPSYTTDDMNGIILDTYNTGNPYPRYMNFIAKSAGDTDSNIGFWTEAVGGSPTEKLRIKSDGIIETGTAIGASGADGDQRLRVGREGNCNIAVRATASTTAYTGIDFGDSGDDRAGRIQYMHDGDFMSFHTNGAGNGAANERLRIKSDGKIKFATNNSTTDYLEYGSNPRLWLRCPSNMNGLRIDASTTPLEIRSSDATGRQISVGGAPNSDISISGDYSLSSGGYDSSPRIYLNTTRHNGSSTVTSFQTSIQAVATSNTNNTGYLGFGGSASPDDLVIKTDGYIGINETDPTKLLTIVKDSTASYNSSALGGEDNHIVRIHNKNGTDNTGVNNHTGLEFIVSSGANSVGQIGLVRTGNNVGDMFFKFRTAASSYAERFRIHNNGKLEASQELTSSVASLFKIGDTQGSFNFEMSDSSGGTDYIKHVKQRFVGKNTYGLTITSRSTLGGSYTKAGEASIKFYYPSAGGGNQAGGQLEFWTNENGYSGTTEAKRMQISRTGNIGAPDGNNIYNASDERLKENMVELTDGLDKIKKLKPISFNWKDGWDESLAGKKEYGFGAQTTQVVDEMLVDPFGTDDTLLNGEVIKNPLRVNEKYIIPLLVKAIQEQQEQIETLKTEISALKSS